MKASAPEGPPPKAAGERSRSPAREDLELDIDFIDPEATISFEQTGVEVYNLETGRSVKLLQKAIASFNYLLSVDFHNVLDIGRRGEHVDWRGTPELFPEVKRCVACLFRIAKRTNGCIFVHSYCHASATRKHVLSTISNTCESLLAELGENAFRFVVLTRSACGRGGKAFVLERLSCAISGLSAEDARRWRAPAIHLDDSTQICESFAHLERIRPVFVRSNWKRPQRRPAAPTTPCPVVDHFCDSVDDVKEFIATNFPGAVDISNL